MEGPSKAAIRAAEETLAGRGTAEQAETMAREIQRLAKSQGSPPKPKGGAVSGLKFTKLIPPGAG